MYLLKPSNIEITNRSFSNILLVFEFFLTTEAKVRLTNFIWTIRSRSSTEFFLLIFITSLILTTAFEHASASLKLSFLNLGSSIVAIAKDKTCSIRPIRLVISIRVRFVPPSVKVLQLQGYSVLTPLQCTNGMTAANATFGNGYFFSRCF